MNMKKNCAIILAAGDGTRMKSKKPKVMAEILFRPMIDCVLDSVYDAGIDDVCVITGSRADILESHLGNDIKTYRQTERLGTAHAVKTATEFIREHIDANVLILNGDAPFMDSETIRAALELHEKGFVQTVISAIVDDPFGYGRIVRSKTGEFKAIIEESSADSEIKKIREINSGAMWFKADDLLEVLPKIGNGNSKGEYYLTDSVEINIADGKLVAACTSNNPDAVLGANSRKQLAELNETARLKVIARLLNTGVDIPCSDGVMIATDADIGPDTRILPNSLIKRGVKVGSDCVIGPNTTLEQCEIGDGSTLNNTDAQYCKIGSECRIGPFVHIRPDSIISDKVRLGNFTEVKNSQIGQSTSVSHLTYVGDSDVGSDVNFGCGCVTVNFTGKKKYRTKIGNGAFIGCNTNLIAPVEIGENAYTAAGSTITDDVPANALSVARARQINKEEWVIRNQPYRREIKK